MKKQKLKILFLILISILFFPSFSSADWEAELKSTFTDAKVVETFDNIKDWKVGGRFYSAAPSGMGIDPSYLPKKLDDSPSQWTLWNSKGIAFQYTPISGGEFTKGDTITGVSSGATATVKQIWVLDGVNYIQITSTDGVQLTTTWQEGENITGNGKVGTIITFPYFIKDNGAEHNWRSTGKSLTMNMGDNENGDTNPAMEGFGTQRLGVFYGDGVSGKSGLKKAHAFFMIRFTPGSFPVDGAGFLYVDVFKLFDMISGFTSIGYWGTPEEHVQASDNGGRLNDYGVNFDVVNVEGGGASNSSRIYLAKNGHVSTAPPASVYDYILQGLDMKYTTDTTMELDQIAPLMDDWIGIEYASDIGTVGNTDGTTDLWLYSPSGTEVGHWSRTGDPKLRYFDHYYNKFVLGGNRLSNGILAGLDSRFWVDDIIINGNRIGPTYFSTLSAFDPQDQVAPAAPSGLAVE